MARWRLRRLGLTESVPPFTFDRLNDCCNWVERMNTKHDIDFIKPKTKRQLQALETKDKIYSAALAVINEKGYRNVNIQDITEAAGVAKGSFYTYFESKDDLVMYTYAQSDTEYRVAYEQVKELDFLTAVTEFVRIAYTKYEKRGKEIIKALIMNYTTEAFADVYHKDRYLLQCLRSLVLIGQHEKALDPSRPDAEYVNILLSVMIGAETMWCFTNQPVGLAEMMAETIRLTAKGMMA